MNNIYMIQACDLHGSEGEKSAYLPYATGMLIAFAFKNECIRSHYAMKRFVYYKEDIEAVIAGMESPAVVGFSTYVWNYEYNKAFAARLKEVFPDCITVFGGHSIEVHSSRQIEKYPFIDFLIHGEGEQAFADILEHLVTDRDFSRVPNISYRENGAVVKTATACITTLDLPSPYLEGYFDELLKDDMIFSALIETNRGCPFRCAYCDWGNITGKIRHFPKERTVAEMRWLAEHRIAFCFCIDSNFGIYQKDYEIVDAFLQIKAETGYPEMFKCCATDSNEIQQFNIHKKLNDCKMLKGASLALQTLTPVVLKNMNRKNISLERFKKLASMYNDANIPTYTELIYGLPGETYDSFADSINTLLETATPKSGFMYFCELLPNSDMGRPENVERFKIKTAKMPFTQFHSEPEKGIIEYSNIIISTYSMDYDMWIDTCIFGLVIQSLHFMGLTKLIAEFLHFEHDITYRIFYEKLIEFAKKHPDTVFGKCYAEIYHKLSAEKRGEYISRMHVNPIFGNIEYQLEEGIALEVTKEYDAFFAELLPLFRSFAAEDEAFDEILRYQDLSIRKFGDVGKEGEFRYDVHKFFRDISVGNAAPLTLRGNTLTFTNLYPTSTYQEYAKYNVWYGRKETKTLYLEKEISVAYRE